MVILLIVGGGERARTESQAGLEFLRDEQQ